MSCMIETDFRTMASALGAVVVFSCAGAASQRAPEPEATGTPLVQNDVSPAAKATPSPASAESPWKGENLQYFPKDITRAKLLQYMREFSFALGVRCQHCHSGGDGISFEGVVFAADDKPAKHTARAMLRMVEHLNTTALAELPSRAEPRVVVACATCHRGLPLPKSLQTTLLETIESSGIEAAITQYRDLRRDQTLSGRYNFGEWEMNELARRLAEAEQVDSAIAILELNGEFNPSSPSIDFQIGELLLGRGDREQAAARYRMVLEKSPQHQGARRRLDEIERQ